jgi:hypothetical protein
LLLPLEHHRTGDDVLLTNVLAFDVQVYDPGAPVFVSNGVAVEPRDPGYSALLAGTPAAFGAYADLGYAYMPPGAAPLAAFNGNPAGKSQLAAPPFVYDTWSLHYESDGVDQFGYQVDDDGDVLVDEPDETDLGANGLDDNGNGVADDLDERDTLPPYAAQLRGIRITLRVYEPDSQQVRESVIVQDFLPD